ncbi:hypothetical protein MA126_004857 [Escherichia coli]|jgi:hypothetical protein|uniref:hypothetical protein n=1 Tax=Escherichia coli TaxID=562 RepID=UPI0002BB7520|nr:hypothetical protein [Escherichia coli]EEC7526434.1 hypothetical protein [Escherichia coli]EET0752058.1 hypothetical protein [Escherichia coli]EET5103986.1 hypothetical protein [Escherichia coli]EFH1183468.1 hypothetical protein [Escherichia coli]EIH5196895.1 hypothetical protein [Escherichia coli]
MQSLPLNASLNDLADREEPSMRKSFVTCRAIPIYHNVALRAPLKRAERDSDVKTTKRDVFPLAKPEKCVRNVFSTLHDYAWN